MQSQEIENKHRGLVLSQPDSVIKVRFTYIEAIRQSDTHFTDIEYPVDMNLGEAVRKLDGTAVIQFSLRVATNPNIAVFAVKGEATLKGSVETVQKLTIPEKNSPPPIWREIYQEAIATITFLARFLEIPPPPIISSA